MRFRSRLRPSHNLIDLTPLVDVIFLLLIFFMITSDILPMKSLNIENPTVDLPSTPLTTRLLVVMDAQQVIYVGAGREILDLASLKEYLAEKLATMEDPTLVLSIDRRVPFEAFLQLFAVAQECCPRLRLAYRESNA